MTARFPFGPTATLVGAGAIAGVAGCSGPGLGLFLGCMSITVLTCGIGFLHEALRDREAPQCLAESCLGLCDPGAWRAGESDILHGGKPP